MMSLFQKRYSWHSGNLLINIKSTSLYKTFYMNHFFKSGYETDNGFYAFILN